MGETPDEIRNEIERTRDEMGDTVEALSYKADVPARAKGWVSDKKDTVVSAVAGTKDTIASKASDVTPDGARVALAVAAPGRRRRGRARDPRPPGSRRRAPRRLGGPTATVSGPPGRRSRCPPPRCERNEERPTDV